MKGLFAYVKINSAMLSLDYLSFTNSHFTMNSPLYRGVPMLENVTYKISNNNEVKITSQMLVMPEYKLRASHTVICKLVENSVRVFTD